MRNIFLIAKREYLERVRAKSFLIMTILVPMLLAGIGGGAALLNGRSKGSSNIAVASPDAAFGNDLKRELPDMNVDVISPVTANTRAELDARNKGKNFDGYLWVTPGAGTQTGSYQWVPKSQADIITKSNVARGIRSTLTRENLLKSGMATNQVEDLMKPIDLDSGNPGAGNKSLAAVGSAYAAFFLMYFVIVYYCMNVARSIIEEKTSRVFEVMLSTITPTEMMAGKVLGVGAVGLTQVGLWLLAAVGLMGSGLLASGMSLSLSPLQILLFVVFFLLGYILYSGVAASLGAMAGSEQELQQMNMILMLPLIVCSMIIFRVITDSDGLIAKVASFIPFTAPLIMYTRVAVHTPPLWQVLLCILELIASIMIVLAFASRIYRVGILMYGKRPNLPEIMKWLRYT